MALEALDLGLDLVGNLGSSELLYQQVDFMAD
jgi:hypothetical protein